MTAIDLEARLRADHPLRAIKRMADQDLAGLSRRFDAAYAADGRPSGPRGTDFRPKPIPKTPGDLYRAEREGFFSGLLGRFVVIGRTGCDQRPAPTPVATGRVAIS